LAKCEFALDYNELLGVNDGEGNDPGLTELVGNTYNSAFKNISMENHQLFIHNTRAG
jgi:hypothetical protein